MYKHKATYKCLMLITFAQVQNPTFTDQTQAKTIQRIRLKITLIKYDG